MKGKRERDHDRLNCIEPAGKFLSEGLEGVFSILCGGGGQCNAIFTFATQKMCAFKIDFPFYK
jgi:hypothetical protein